MKKVVCSLISVLFILSMIGCSLDEEEVYVVTGDKLEFSTVDINGNPVTEDIIKGAKVVLVNFWEPWCGPCVSEMPDLEELYENYKDEGLLIIGVFSTTDMKKEVKSVLKECNTSYPIICSEPNLEKYMTDYVPTTVIADSEGNIISPEPIIGSNSYSDWEDIIQRYLN